MSAELVEFFDLIHPPTGWRCLFTLPERSHYWYNNSIDIAEQALAMDARGLTVFHSCAVFTERTRKQEHVEAVKIFWFDIDAGEDKPYRTANEAFLALEAWRPIVQMPPSMIVSSGSGIHAYWPLVTALPLTEWKPRAERMRALALQHGLQIDAAATTDAARVLRPPGTHNRKLYA